MVRIALDILARILVRLILLWVCWQESWEFCYRYLGKNLGKSYRVNLGKIYYRPTLTLTSHLRQNVGLREG